METAVRDKARMMSNKDLWPGEVLPVLQRRDPLPAVTGYIERDAGPVVELTDGGRVHYDSFAELATAWEID